MGARVESCPMCGSPDILELFRMKAGTMPDEPFDLVVRSCGHAASVRTDGRRSSEQN